MAIVEAEEFRLVDSDGNIRAQLGFEDASGNPEGLVVLRMSSGATELALSAYKDLGASLVLTGAGGQTIVSGNVNGGDIYISSKSGARIRISFQYSPDKVVIEALDDKGHRLFGGP